jgi:uncharacterized membrane protein
MLKIRFGSSSGYCDGVSRRSFLKLGAMTIGSLTLADLFRAQAQSFLAASVGQQPPLCTLEDGVQALRVNLAALKSGEERSVQMILTG